MNTSNTFKVPERKASIALLIILGATVYGYHAVLGNFFHGDDFVHLSWLGLTLNNPDLIWRNFHSAWLDIPTARFYRPLISIFMVFDYALWHGNGIGFHITNLVCHLLNTVLFWLIIVDLPQTASHLPGKGDLNSEPVQTWALASAALFALYPLHPESVSWITGRVDTIVTMFCLMSLWFYMRWRLRTKPGWLIASSLTFVLGLLSKEMAIVMPALFATYEIIYCINLQSINAEDKITAKSILITSGKSLSNTALFWLILAGYFMVRRLALGTFIGGYDDSLFAIPSKTIFLKNWLHSVGMTLLPINKGLFGSHNPLTYIWIVLLIASLLCGVRVLATQAKEYRHVLFLAGWLILSLLPIFKLFNIGDDLQGSRLIYFGSVPLCALLTFGFANLGYVDNSPKQVQLRMIGRVMLSLVLSLSALVLMINNLAWQQAGEMSQAIVQQLDRFYKQIDGDPPVYLVGLPDNIYGAYVCRNALPGMTKFPQISRSVNNCFMLTSAEHSFPFGFARNSIERASDSRILQWDSKEKLFHALSLPTEVEDLTPSWVRFPAIEKTTGNNSIVLLVKNLPCWTTHIITLKCRAPFLRFPKSEATISLMYINDLQKEFSLSRRVAATIKNTSSAQAISFPLHSDVDWSLGGTCHQLKFVFPKECLMENAKLEIPPLYSMMPKLSFNNSANQNELGYIQLNGQHPSCQLDFEAKEMPQVSFVSCEISKPNTFFVTANGATPDNDVATFHKYAGQKGHITLRLDDFPISGIYQARLRAMDREENPRGFAGDQIMITVSK